MTIIGVLLFVAILIYGICCGIKVNIDRVIDNKREAEHQAFISNSRDQALHEIGGYTKNRILEYRPRGFIFAVDKSSGFVNMCNNEAGHLAKVPNEHIVGCEIKKDVIRKGHSSGTYYNDGGLALGGSSISERIIIRRYSVVVRLVNERRPAIEFLLIDRPSEAGLSTVKTMELEDKTIYEDSAAFEECRKFAEGVNDVVQSISAANQRIANEPIKSIHAAPVQPVMASYESKANATHVQQILCPQCGAIQGIDSKFCNQCGCKLEIGI